MDYKYVSTVVVWSRLVCKISNKQPCVPTVSDTFGNYMGDKVKLHLKETEWSSLT